MGLDKRLKNLPWITEEGFLDPARFPIDDILKQALSKDDERFRSGVTFLASMQAHGRQEAGVFLMGLLWNHDDRWERRSAIVEALKGTRTQACADLLFHELKRVKSSNSTRRYLGTVIQVLASMPAELVQEGFESLAGDKSFSSKMRAKFRQALGEDEFLDEDLGW